MGDIFSGDVYDPNLINYYYQFDPNEKEFQEWKNIVNKFTYQKSKNYYDIYIPTLESSQYTWFL